MIYIPWAGEKIFKYKQSSDWFCRNGNKRFKYSKRPFGIFSNAPVSFCMFGNRCGHTGLNLSEMRIPFHGDGARVGLNLFVEKREREREKNEKISVNTKLNHNFSLWNKQTNQLHIQYSTPHRKWAKKIVRCVQHEIQFRKKKRLVNGLCVQVNCNEM